MPAPSDPIPLLLVRFEAGQPLRRSLLSATMFKSCCHRRDPESVFIVLSQSDSLKHYYCDINTLAFCSTPIFRAAFFCQMIAQFG